MERQRIKDEIGALEERLELLDLTALANESYPVTGQGKYDFRSDLMVREALVSLRRIQGLVHEEKLEKSLDAEDFLRRVTSLLVREAGGLGLEVALSTYGSGRISLEMVEVTMGAILACVRATLKNFKSVSAEQREEKHLFPTYSIYLEVRATADEVHFRLMDDGRGYGGSFRNEFETEQHFHRIRTHISRFGGWFRRQSLPQYGGSIEFRAAMSMSRFDCLLLKTEALEILLPQGCVAEVLQQLPSDLAVEGKLAVICENRGLSATLPAFLPGVAVRVAVADFQFVILCESVETAARTRRVDAEGLVERQAWFKNFGVFHRQAIPQVLPLLDGESLMSFHVECWGADESI